MEFESADERPESHHNLGGTLQNENMSQSVPGEENLTLGEGGNDPRVMAEPPSRALKKDSKSFTQNLFDTDAVRLSQWKALHDLAVSQNDIPSTACEHNLGEVSSLSSNQKPIPNYTTSERSMTDVLSQLQDLSAWFSAVALEQEQAACTAPPDEQRHTPPTRDMQSASTLKKNKMESVTSSNDGGLVESVPRRHNRKVSFDHVEMPFNTTADASDASAIASKRNPDHAHILRSTKHEESSSTTYKVATVPNLSYHAVLALKQNTYQRRNDGVDGTSNTIQCGTQSLAAQSVVYNLGRAHRLLQSFRLSPNGKQGDGRVRRFPLDVSQLEDSFQILDEICPREVTMHSLWETLGELFNYPDDFLRLNRDYVQSPALVKVKEDGCAATRDKPYINDVDATYILFVALSAFTGTVTRTDPETWAILRQIRSNGGRLPSDVLKSLSEGQIQKLLDATDALDFELSIRMGERLVRAIAARVVYYEILKGRRSRSIRRSTSMNVVDGIIEYFRRCTKGKRNPTSDTPELRKPNPAMAAVEVLRTLIQKDWCGCPEVHRSSVTGGAIQLLAAMYKNRNSIGLVPEDFHTPFLANRLDLLEMPADFLTKSENNRTFHLLSYPFLFPPRTLVQYFRSMNYSTMSRYYEEALANERHLKNIAMSSRVDIHSRYPGLVRRMQTATLSFLLVVARRDKAVTDALDQLWRREKRELLRPLKVIMGVQEGEEGVDHGGVQQEFFRTVMAEILNPDYGMFTVDPVTYSTWFQPGSLEPLYKFELLGLLVSLAVYNGLTLPVNFPIALYMKLLDEKVRSIDHIRNGWPELAKGFEDLLAWSEGDVGDIFMRTYEFSFNAFGTVINVDMEKVGRNEPWSVFENDSKQQLTEAEHVILSSETAVHSDPFHGKGSMIREYRESPIYRSRAARTASHNRNLPVLGILKGSNVSSPASPTTTSKKRLPPSWEKEEASMVTNENREQFVKDYIFWLTDKSIRPQYDAFARGFYACLDRTALSLFTPETLKRLVEGSQHIDIAELEKHTKYHDGYYPEHPAINMFWDIVRQFTPEKAALLLEFVTASDRVPVNGISSIAFIIQRAGNSDSVCSYLLFLSLQLLDNT